jgi:predicted ATPase
VYRYDVVDPWIVARSYLSWAFWLLGEPDVARMHSEEAVHIAEELDHSFSLTLALSFSQWIHQFNRDVVRTRETAEKTLALAQEHGFAFWFGWCQVMRGWAMSQQGEHAEGITEIEEGLVSWRAQGSELGSHYYYGLLAEACLTAGRLDKASTALDQAETFAANTGEGYWLPEVIRLRGELLLRATPADTASAETKFREALAIAAQQDARSLQLRSAFSLAKLLHTQGRSAEARDVLEPICQSFTDANRSAELDAARTFLSAMGD